MWKCPKCGQEFSDSDNKCWACGLDNKASGSGSNKASFNNNDSVPNTKDCNHILNNDRLKNACPKCHKEYDDTWKVCLSCGCALEKRSVADNGGMRNENTQEKVLPVKSKLTKGIIGGLGALCLLSVPGNYYYGKIFASIILSTIGGILLYLCFRKPPAYASKGEQISEGIFWGLGCAMLIAASGSLGYVNIGIVILYIIIGLIVMPYPLLKNLAKWNILLITRISLVIVLMLLGQLLFYTRR